MRTPYLKQRTKDGRAYAHFVTRLRGKKIDVYLGRWGTADAQRRYGEELAKLQARREPRPCDWDIREPSDGPPKYLIELLVDYADYCAAIYRKSGRPTKAAYRARRIARIIRETPVYQSMTIEEFGPRALEDLMAALAAEEVQRGDVTARRFCRRSLNDLCSMYKSAYKWAVREELIDESLYRRLATVNGFTRGRPIRPGTSTPRESPPKQPLAWQTVKETIPHLPPAIAAMVQVQWHSGMRPLEVVGMRWADLDEADGVWIYRPTNAEARKLDHMGVDRVVLLGPQAMAHVTPWVELAKRHGIQYVYSPVLSEIARGRTRKSLSKHRSPGLRYTVTIYGRAVRRACERAFLPAAGPMARKPEETKALWIKRLESEHAVELAAWRREHRWTPVQLRHAWRTRMEPVYGLEHVSAAMGHAKVETTQLYGQRSMQLAAKVAREAG